MAKCLWLGCIETQLIFQKKKKINEKIGCPVPRLAVMLRYRLL